MDDFTRFLNFLKTVQRSSFEGKIKSPEYLFNSSNFFKKNFKDEYKELTPEYKERYLDIIQGIPFYKDLNSNHRLIELMDFNEVIRNIFQHEIDKEIKKLINEGYSFPKPSFDDFIQQIEESESLPYGFKNTKYGIIPENLIKEIKGWPKKDIEDILEKSKSPSFNRNNENIPSLIKKYLNNQQFIDSIFPVLHFDTEGKIKEAIPECYGCDLMIESPLTLENSLLETLEGIVIANNSLSNPLASSIQKNVQISP